MARPYRIVVGYDGSESGRHALERALGLVGYGSRLMVVHVALNSTGVERGNEVVAEAERTLAEHRVYGEAVMRVGNPSDELIDAVRESNADLLVVGNGKNALQRLVLGSVSTEVVHRAPCDVLVAR